MITISAASVRPIACAVCSDIVTPVLLDVQLQSAMRGHTSTHREINLPCQIRSLHNPYFITFVFFVGIADMLLQVNLSAVHDALLFH